MIEINNSLSDESTDVVFPTETTHSSSGVGGSSTLCSTENIKYDALSIKHFLKNQPEKTKLVDNPKTNTVKPSPCWTQFALPAFKDENNRNIIISKFATCGSCYTTSHGSKRAGPDFCGPSFGSGRLGRGLVGHGRAARPDLKFYNITCTSYSKWKIPD